MFIQLAINGVIAGSNYALIALSFTIIYKTVKFFHFAHGVVYAAGAYFAFAFITLFDINIFIGIILSIILAAILGVSFDRFVYYPLRKKNAPNFVYFIASFGVFIFIQNLLQFLFGAQILTLKNMPIKEGHHIGGAIVTDIQFYIIFISMLLCLLGWIFIQRTNFGKAIRAVADDPIGARTLGINSEKILIVAFGIGSALAGAAGILISLETNIEPTMGMNAILKGIIASIIGGIGSIPGTILGGLSLGLAENLGIWKIQAGWKDCIAFVILIVFLLIRPGGIMGIKTKNE